MTVDWMPSHSFQPTVGYVSGVNRPKLILLIILGVPLMATLALAGIQVARTPTAPRTAATSLGWNQAKESIAFPDLRGHTLLSGSRRSPEADGTVLVNFWAAWCGPCRKELPLLQELSDSGLVEVVGISRDFNKKAPLDLVDELGVTYANYLDSDAEVAASIRDAAPITGLPTSVLVVEGTITAIHVGEFTSYKELRQEILDRIP